MLKVGMYVRCPVDEEIKEARTYLLGQVTAFNEDTNTVEVIFHDPLKLRLFFAKLPKKAIYEESYLSRTSALENSSVMFKGQKVRLLSVSKVAAKESPYYNYFVEYLKDGKATVGEVSETQIEIPFTRSNYNPAYQMLKYELQNPKWYLERRIVSKSLNIIANAPNGFKNLLGTRVHLYSHQVDTIIRALSEKPCRLMLADEVGLGKTIEALAIIKGMLDKYPNMRSLIIVPETLIYQWQTELSIKFWFDVPIWVGDNTENSQMLLVSSNVIEKDHNEIFAYCKWDMCVIDETHKLLGNDDLYNVILGLCKKVENILLLSATPILHREQEYHKLLTLLNPSRYEKMPVNTFDNLLNRQKIIRDIVFNLMRDLSDYLEYNLRCDFVDGLSQINAEIKDHKLAQIILNIEGASPDKGLSFVKLALSYIAEFYQIERGIIRHRRVEIASANIKRELIDISYEMVGAETGFFEENCYNAVVDYAGTFCQRSHDESSMDFVKKIITAVSSSPYALLELINNKRMTEDSDVMSEVVSLAKKWEKAVESEISHIKDVCDDVGSFNSKFARIVDYIDQEDVNSDKKFLIFTGFTATAKKLEECFKQFFGANTTCSFHSGKTGEEMQEAATLFQNHEEFRFMICDESGGEGRNFQIADYIIHCDLPWSPALLEQRIGRLDRIGRDNSKNVVSVVVHSENSLENDLFNIFDKGLNIFNESLCGMEIAFEQVHNTIETALKNDVRFGLANITPDIAKFAEQMNVEIEKERYFDLARQLDTELQEKLEKLIAHFTVNDGEQLMNTMMAWPHMAGFTKISYTNAFKDGSKVVSIDTSDLNSRSMENTLYFPPKMSEIIRRSKYNNDIRGTFSRTAAVKHENLTFFAPFNPLFDSITINAEECYKGRSVALKYEGCELKWKGLLQTWNVKYNPLMLYKKGFSPDLISLISRYLPSEQQIIYSRGINPQFTDILTIEVVEQLESLNKKKPIHLGKRDNGMIDSFKKYIPVDKWRDYIKKSYNLGKRYASEQTKMLLKSENARIELEKLLTANIAREIFYDHSDENALLKNTEAIDALIYGLENPIIELDSIALIIFE